MAGMVAAPVAAGGDTPLSPGSTGTSQITPQIAPQIAVDPNLVRRGGVGVRGWDPSRTSPGFTLFSPSAVGRTTYLVDLAGTVAHSWVLPYPPGMSGYLTERGTLFYNGSIPNDSFIGRSPYHGGAALEVDWTGRVLWEVRHPDHHHDGIRLRNGNVLLICATALPDEVARRVQGGRPGSEADGFMYGDYLVEMTTAGETVWTWRSWEHLDPQRDRITAPMDSREEWTHANAVEEMPDGNLLISFRNISTLVRVDRRSGAITWRLGAPPLSGQHSPTVLPNGNILVFDNGPHRVDETFPYSRVLEIDPATNEIVWRYQEVYQWLFFSARVSSAQRLPDGNTLVCEGLTGRVFEVTPGGDVVWEYVNPYFGPPNAPARAQTNPLFRAYRYTPDHVARAQRAV